MFVRSINGDITVSAGSMTIPLTTRNGIGSERSRLRRAVESMVRFEQRHFAALLFFYHRRRKYLVAKCRRQQSV
jgi:hypothetical protein